MGCSKIFIKQKACADLRLCWWCLPFFRIGICSSVLI